MLHTAAAAAAAIRLLCHTQITVEVEIQFSPFASFQYPTRIPVRVWMKEKTFFIDQGAKGRKNYSHPNQSISWIKLYFLIVYAIANCTRTTVSPFVTQFRSGNALFPTIFGTEISTCWFSDIFLHTHGTNFTTRRRRPSSLDYAHFRTEHIQTFAVRSKSKPRPRCSGSMILL